MTSPSARRCAVAVDLLLLLVHGALSQYATRDDCFVRYPDKQAQCINGYESREAISEDGCLALCLNEQNINCRSVQYNRNTRRCDLYSIALPTAQAGSDRAGLRRVGTADEEQKRRRRRRKRQVSPERRRAIRVRLLQANGQTSGPVLVPRSHIVDNPDTRRQLRKRQSATIANGANSNGNTGNTAAAAQQRQIVIHRQRPIPLLVRQPQYFAGIPQQRGQFNRAPIPLLPAALAGHGTGPVARGVSPYTNVAGQSASASGYRVITVVPQQQYAPQYYSVPVHYAPAPANVQTAGVQYAQASRQLAYVPVAYAQQGTGCTSSTGCGTASTGAGTIYIKQGPSGAGNAYQGAQQVYVVNCNGYGPRLGPNTGYDYYIPTGSCDNLQYAGLYQVWNG